MKQKPWKVYVHINKTNGKLYVGVTSKAKPEHRWREGRGYHENTHFASAIKKYGWDNFKHIILFDDLTEEQAKYTERLLIMTWQAQDNKHGYNMTSGGDGTPNYHPSDETRLKLSEARRKENLSEETLRRRSIALKGRKFTNEHKRKISQGNSKAVYMMTMDGVFIRSFKSALCAEVETGINHSHISQCCHNKRNSTGGYRWRFAQ